MESVRRLRGRVAVVRRSDDDEAVGRRTNLALEGLLVVALVTGVLGFLTGSGPTRWILVVHGTAGLAIVLLVPWKSATVRRGLGRRRPDAWVSIAFGAAVALTIGLGVLHSTGVWHTRGTWSAMGIHIMAAVITVPLLWRHVAKRPQRFRREDISRRSFLRAGAIGGAALVARTVTRDDLRFTGSFEIASFVPDRMPVVQWFDDDPPRIEPDAWRLRIGADELTLSGLTHHGDELVATLDCTSGWFSTQVWRGVWLDRLLGPDPGGRSIVVGSATGFSRRFPMGDRDRLFLATHLGGEPLTRGHGAPVRLVAPGRRGMWWVKWVTSVEISDRPWWLQSPVPLS